MKILVTGATGQLGFDCVAELKKQGYNEVLGVSSSDFNLTNKEDTEKYILDYKPELIIHCAAYTNVDKAEAD